MMASPQQQGMRRQKNFSIIFRDLVVARAVSGVSKFVLAPIANAKILKQASNHPSVLQRYDGNVFQCVTRMVRENGWSALWRGSLVNNLIYWPSQIAVLLFEDALMSFVGVSQNHFIQETISFVASTCMNGIQTAVSFPLTHARNNVVIDMLGVPHDEGWNRYWFYVDYRAFGAAIAGSIVYKLAGMFTSRYIAPISPYAIKHGLPEVVSTVIFRNFVPRVFAWLFCYPFITAGRCLMMDGSLPVGKQVYNGTLHCLSEIYKNEGLRGLYTGFGEEILETLGGIVFLMLYMNVISPQPTPQSTPTTTKRKVGTVERK